MEDRRDWYIKKCLFPKIHRLEAETKTLRRLLRHWMEDEIIDRELKK